MVEVKVCVGSSCHIKGGAKTLKLFKELIEAHGVRDRVSLAADLCLNNCTHAPNVVVNEMIYGNVTPDRAEQFFMDNILAKVNAHADSGDNYD